MPKSRKDIYHLNAGEWSKKVYNRIDHDKHSSACRQARNFISQPHGTLIKRKGFEMVAPAKYDDRACTTVRFRFSKDDTVLLEIGDEYIRFHQDGTQVREAAKTISSTTAANPVVATSATHGYSNGDEIYVFGLTEMTELNGRWLKVASVTTNTFELTDRDGVNIDGSTWTAESTGGEAEKVYEIVSVYGSADLANLDYSQKNDVMFFVDGSKPAQRLIRFGDTSWTLTEYEYAFPAVRDPNVEAGQLLECDVTDVGDIGTMTASGHTPFTSDHVGSYWVLRHFRESEEVSNKNGLSATDNISSFAVQALGNLTLETEGKWAGSVTVYKAIVKNPSLTSYTASEWIVAGKYTSGDATGDGQNFNVRFTQDEVSRYYFCAYTGDNPKATLRSEATLIEGAVKVTDFNSSTSVDIEVVADLDSTGTTEDWSEGAWSDVRGYPSTVCFFEKALWFGRNDEFPQGIWKSEVDIFDSFKLTDSETSGLFIELDAKERNDILWIVPSDKLMVGTSGSEWTVSGTDLNSVISRTNIVARRQENKGSRDLRPETIDNVVMFVQRGSSNRLRAQAFSLERDKFHGEDMQVFSEHLTTSGFVSMAYQSSPDPVLWCCMGNGTLLSFTYDRDQNVYAWNPHETNGDIEDVETIYGSEDDEVWVTVRRTIDGSTRRFIERLSGYYNPVGTTGLIAFIIDLSGSMQPSIDAAKAQAINLATEMSARYDQSLFALYTIADTGNTVVQKSAFANVTTVVGLIDALQAINTGTENGFEAIVRVSEELPWGDYGDSDRHIVVITDEDSDNSETQANAQAAALNVGAKVSFGKNATLSGTASYEPIRVATGGARWTTDAGLSAAVIGVLELEADVSSEKRFLDCSLRVNVGGTTTITGLWHLEGATVEALIDGYHYTDLTVTNGSITLSDIAILAYVGLPFTSTFQPLQLNADATVGSSKGYTKNVDTVYAQLINTIGLKYSDGTVNSAGDLTYRDLSFRSGNQDQTLPPQLFDGDVEIPMQTGHSKDPTFILKHDMPLPFTLAGVVIHYEVTGY